MACTNLLYISQQLGHHIELVIPREDHSLRNDFTGFFIPLHLQMQILVEDFQQPIFV